MRLNLAPKLGLVGLTLSALSGCWDCCDGSSDGPGPGKLDIAGQMSKGAVAGATCTATTLAGAVLGTGTTDASGVFSFSLNIIPTEPYKLTCEGGSYFNEATGQTEPFTGTMRSIAPSGTTSVAVTPLTDVAAQYIEDLGTVVTDGNVNAVLEDIGSFFGVDDILSPPQVIDDPADLDALEGTEAGAYAAVLAGLANLVESTGADAEDILQALSDDIADGVLGDDSGTLGIAISQEAVDSATAEVAEGTEAATIVEENQNEPDRNNGEVSGTGGTSP